MIGERTEHQGPQITGAICVAATENEATYFSSIRAPYSSEIDTLEFLDCLLEEDEDDEDTEDLSDITGTTTGDSEEQFSQLATLSLAIRGTLPSSLQKLSLASLL